MAKKNNKEDVSIKDTKKGIEEIDTPVENIETIKREDVETMDELDTPNKDEITEEEVQAVANAIVEEANEEDKTIEEVVNDIVNEDNNIISLDNAPVSPLIQSEDEIIPKNFVKVPPKKPTIENKIKLRNGRVYKEVGNGYGMYADNGETFRI